MEGENTVGENRRENIRFLRIGMSSMSVCVTVCVSVLEVLRTCTQWFAGRTLSTQRHLCSQIYFTNTLNRGTDGSGWVWRNRGPNILYPPPPTPTTHAECTMEPHSKMQQHVCGLRKPAWLSGSKVFIGGECSRRSNSQLKLSGISDSRKEGRCLAAQRGWNSQVPNSQPRASPQMGFLKTVPSGTLC